ncbi:MAG: glycosyltransferase family 1 protein [Deltaproteobacteria bacterium]|nr:glycosyltransferase family 1 protein [Deltaproteobacteria bacterium]
MAFDHYPNILTQSYGQTGTYSIKFNNTNISYPDYQTIKQNLKKNHYDLIITTVCHVDYRGGKHGFFSEISRRLKYSFESNMYKLGGTLVLDWIKQGIKLPPFIVLDDTDDPFIFPVDYELLSKSLIYFKRELPLDRFFTFRLFEAKLSKQQKVPLVEKILPLWLSYDLDSIAAFTNPDEIKPYNSRSVDISYLTNLYMSYNRLKLLPHLDNLEAKYKVVTTKQGKFDKKEFYGISKDSKISISLEGRGWDCAKHYELMICGSLMFITRPTMELAFNLIDGQNCVFVDSEFRDLEERVKYYLDNPQKSSEVAKNGYDLAKNQLTNDKLVDYVLEKTLKAMKQR